MFRPTVDSVLDGFNKAIEQLNGIATRESAVAMNKRNQAVTLNAEADAASAEMQRAERVADKISALVS